MALILFQPIIICIVRLHEEALHLYHIRVRVCKWLSQQNIRWLLCDKTWGTLAFH